MGQGHNYLQVVQDYSIHFPKKKVIQGKSQVSFPSCNFRIFLDNCL